MYVSSGARIAAILVAIGTVVLVVSLLPHMPFWPSGVTVSGKQLSNSEANNFLDDVAQLFEGAGPAGQFKNLAYVPKSKQGGVLKQLLIETANNQRAFETEFAKLELDLERVARESERGLLRQQVAKMRIEQARYLNRSKALVEEFKGLLKINEEVVKKNQSESDRLLGMYTALYDQYDKFLDFWDKHRPSLVKGQPLFETQRQVDAYNKIVADLTSIAEATDKANSEVMESRSKSIAKSLETLRGK